MMKALIGANVAMFLLVSIVQSLQVWLGLIPEAVVRGFYVWQLATYMFIHAGVFHLLFNMLVLWMIGTELERMWGMRYFLKFYFVTGIGAGALTVLISLLPFGFAATLYHAVIIGASGAIFGLLLAYALYFPDRLIYMYFLFPIKVKYFRRHPRRDRAVFIAGRSERRGKRDAPRRADRGLTCISRVRGSIQLARSSTDTSSGRSIAPEGSLTCIPAAGPTTGIAGCTRPRSPNPCGSG
jgi:membrane associated rhomboid family serine protease